MHGFAFLLLPEALQTLTLRPFWGNPPFLHLKS